MQDSLSLSGWKPICNVDDIPVLGARRVTRAAGMDIAIFRNSQDQVFALLDRCPHKGGPLNQGIVFGTSVACPLHNWTIALDNGCAREPDTGCAQPFQIKVVRGVVYLLASEIATLAIDAGAPVAGPARS